MNIHDVYASAYQLTTPRSKMAANVPLSLVSQIPDANIEREYRSRVGKMIPQFNKQAESVYDITIFNIKKDLEVNINDQIVDVAKGMQKGDGHTRIEGWTKHDPSFVPEKVNVKFVDIETPEQYVTEYYSYDSLEATEKNAHKITGALNLLKIDMRSTRGKKGNFGESVRYAYPYDSKCWVAQKIGYFQNELPLVDKYIMQVDSKELRQFTSTLTSAFLIALKIYGEPAEQKQQLISMMKKLNTITKDDWQLKHHPNNDDHSRWDGAQMIMREAINQSVTTSGTKRVDYINSVNFYLYCINNWMQGKYLKKVIADNFKDCYSDAMDILENQ
jgi:hypothetical protein